MLTAFSGTEMIVFLSVIFVANYFLGTFVHEIVDAEGFGIVGNTVVLTAGVLLGLYLSAIYLVPQTDYVLLGVCGVAGAFGLLSTLILSKIALRRLGM